MKKRKLTILISFIFLSIHLIQTQPVNGINSTTIYVDDDNTKGPWDGSLKHPFQYIQNGIDEADYGDTVFVYSGTYHENLVINKTIHLIGEEKNFTIIKEANMANYIIQVFDNNVKISQFTIKNGGNDTKFVGGIYLNSSSNNSTISDNVIQNNNLHGIMIESVDSTDIIENVIIGNEWGVVIESSEYNKITGNRIIGNKRNGIEMESSDGNTILENIICGNEEGIDIDNSNENSIIGNNITGNDWGIIIFESNNNNVKENIISESDDLGIGIFDSRGNKISRNSICYNEQGIDVAVSSWNSIKENNFVKSKSIHASSVISLLHCSYFDFWFHNYWDNWPGLIPKPILSEIIFGVSFFYWVQFDWHPAKEPFDIDVSDMK